MRTEAEVREAIGHIDQALSSQLAALAPPEVKGAFAMLRDALKWVIEDSNSRFEKEVLIPCRRVDRAARQ